MRKRWHNCRNAGEILSCILNYYIVILDKAIEMITKTSLINSLEKLPENLTIDQVIDHIIFMEKVQKGLDDSANGRVYSKGEARKKLSKWLK